MGRVANGKGTPAKDRTGEEKLKEIVLSVDIVIYQWTCVEEDLKTAQM